MKDIDEILVEKLWNDLPAVNGSEWMLFEKNVNIRKTIETIIQLFSLNFNKMLSITIRFLRKLKKLSNETLPLHAQSIEILYSHLVLLRIISFSIFRRSTLSLDLKEALDSPKFSEFSKIYPLPSLDTFDFLDESLAKYVFMTVVSYEYFHISSYSLVSSIMVNAIGFVEKKHIIIDDIIKEISQHTSRIVFYISIANWNVAFQFFQDISRKKLSNIEEDSFQYNFFVLECFCLDYTRMTAVLHDLVLTFPRMRKNYQIMVANSLRIGIWNWIHNFPAEFISLHKKQRGTSNAILQIFDIIYGSSITQKRKDIFWPLNMILLVICPDVFNEEFEILRKLPVFQKKLFFLDDLKRALDSPKMFPVAINCYIDLLKATSFSPPLISLRKFTPKIEQENRVFENILFRNEESVISKQNFVDAFVSFFVLDITHFIEKILEQFFGSKAILFNQLIFYKCFPWIPFIKLYPKVIIHLEFILKELLIIFKNSDYIYSALQKSKNVEKKELIDAFVSILNILESDPEILQIMDTQCENEDILSIFSFIFSQCMNSIYPLINSVMKFILYLYCDPNLFLWKKLSDSPKGPRRFWIFTSHLMLSILGKLLDIKSSSNSIKFFIEVFTNLVHYLTRLLNVYEVFKSASQLDIVESTSLNVVVEMAFLILLCSSNMEIYLMSIKAFGFFFSHHQLLSLDFSDHLQISFDSNFSIYNEFITNTSPISRDAFQKGFRLLLNSKVRATSGIIMTWDEMLKRWSMLLNIIVDIPSDRVGFLYHKKFSILKRRSKTEIKQFKENIEGNIIEWRNYTGFLVALSACCLDYATSSKCFLPNNGLFSITKGISGLNELEKVIMQFFEELVNLLSSSSVIVRENVRVILGSDLSQKLYLILFHSFESTIKGFFDFKGEIIKDEKNVIFIEQVIILFKDIFDKMDNSFDMYFFFDFFSLILYIARYLDLLEKNMICLEIRLKFCYLCEIVILRDSNFQRELKRRNSILEIIYNWVSDFLKANDDTFLLNEFYGSDNELQKKIDLNSIKIISQLLYKLPFYSLNLLDDVNDTKMSDILFYTYFNFFKNLLFKCKFIKTKDFDFSSKDNSGIESPNSVEFLNELTLLWDFVVLGLSNLLFSNMRYVLEHYIYMCYYDNMIIRNVFIRILTMSFKQDIKLENFSEDIDKDKYGKMIDFLLKNPRFIMVLCDVCPSIQINHLASSLYRIFSSKGKGLYLLEMLIEKEVMETRSESELFRRNSIVSKMLSVFARIEGSRYINEVFKPLLQKVLYNPDIFCLELDPSKIDSKKLNDNISSLKSIVGTFLDAICSSVVEIPRAIKKICHCIVTYVSKKFPDFCYISVGGFIFLRFLCPIILSPESENISLESALKDNRRGLLLVVKVIQNLANNVVFGEKEPYMTVLNDFLEENLYRVTEFLKNISLAPENDELGSLLIISFKYDCLYIHSFLVEYNDLIRTGLMIDKRNISDRYSGDSIQKIKSLFDEFGKILDFLGLPLQRFCFKMPSDCILFEFSNIVFDKFMEKNSIKNIESNVDFELVRQGGVSRDKRPILYLSLRKFTATYHDFKDIVYYFLKTFQSVWDNFFEVMIDSTGYNISRENAFQLFQIIILLLPSQAFSNCSVIYFLNLSTYLRKKLQNSFEKILSLFKFSKILFLFSKKDLEIYADLEDFGLSKETISFFNDTFSTFHSAIRYKQYESWIDVSVKIGDKYIQIFTDEKYDIFHTTSSYISDIYHISEVDLNIFVDSTEKENIFFRLNYENDSILFDGAIKKSKAKYLSLYKNYMDGDFYPRDIQGRLLNIALLNLANKDDELRASSYLFFCLLGQLFYFDLGLSYLNLGNIFMPKNNDYHIIFLSEKLSFLEPQLTLQFLDEFCYTFPLYSLAEKHYSLFYVSSWLNNFEKVFYDGHKGVNFLEKVRQIIRLFIDFSLNNQQFLRLIDISIWSVLGKINKIFDIIIDELIFYGIAFEYGTPQYEIILHICMAMQSVCLKSKILIRIRKALVKSSAEFVYSLVKSEVWLEISILIHIFLIFSFTNHQIIFHLPDIFYVVSLILKNGSNFQILSIYKCLISSIHSFCIFLPINRQNFSKLKALFDEFQTSKFRLLFGLDLINVANFWRSRWMSLVVSIAFGQNIAIQTRAMISLGCLADDKISDDIIRQVFFVLNKSLAEYAKNNILLFVSVLMCLSRMMQNMSIYSKYYQIIFWLSVSIIQIEDINLFGPAVSLMQSSIRVMNESKYFTKNPISFVLLSSMISYADIVKQLDENSGVCFGINFSFSIVVILLKGLRESSTRSITIDLLMSFLEATVDFFKATNYMKMDILSTDILAFIVPLLFVSQNIVEMKELLSFIGINDLELRFHEISDISSILYTKFEIPDNMIALLFLSTIMEMLDLINNEHEQVVLYSILIEASVIIPETFRLICDELKYRLSIIMNTSQNPSLLNIVQRLYLIIVSNSYYNVTGASTQSRILLLQDLEFSGLKNCCYFSDLTENDIKKRLDLVEQLIAIIINDY
ncbi:hypothetical protein PMAC_003111 [Pneumocystis sp. 'macacae']|nr:hypothetical protein PMAC_003111 [Pneumocystis sp. 'macacae']